MIARRLIVRGRVQGVGYRDATIQAATAFGVAGWVRNRHDGTVEAFVQGEAASVERTIDWCRRGPPAARVTAVDVADAALDERLAGFTMKGSA
jgi:acylphosphatase